jgi:hypothetical protein
VHLSKDSNTKDLAYSTVKNYLENKGINIDIEVVPQETQSEIHQID